MFLIAPSTSRGFAPDEGLTITKFRFVSVIQIQF